MRILENGRSAPTGVGSSGESSTRQRIDLAGTWLYSLDEELWTEVKVPSAFDVQGRVVFLRKFTVGESLVNNFVCRLVSYGINYESEFYINDDFVGKHVGGYTSFKLDVPENTIQPGSENVLKIVVSNLLSARNTLPLRQQIWGWRNYGGILRDIYLEAVPRLWLESIQVQTTLEEDLKRGSVRIAAIISNNGFQGLTVDTVKRKARGFLYQMILDLSDKLTGALVAQTAPYSLSPEMGKDTEANLAFAVNSVKPWSTETPDLYVLKVTLVKAEGKKRTVLDEQNLEIGFRSVALREGALLLNGKRAQLKGVIWHEDSPDHGSAMTYEQMEKDIVLIKSLGANAIRFAFHPPHPYVVTLCSRYGLLALQEIPAWNVPGEVLGDDFFQMLGEQQTREMIRRDQHQPAMLAWGVGDDFDSSDPRARTYVERMVRVAKEADARPVYYGSKMLGIDVCSDLVDIACVSVPANDLKEFKALLTEWTDQHKSQPVMLIRYGKTVQSNNHNGYSDPMSEEAQARFFMQYFAAIRELGISGSFIQSFSDWRGDRPVLTVEQHDQYLHPVGLLSYEREKRLAFDVVKLVFAGQRVQALPIGKHRGSFPVVHIVAGFLVIFLLAYQYHYNRRFSESFKRSLLRAYNFFADLREVRSVSVFHTLLLSVMISLTLAVVLSSLLYFFRTDVLADYVITQLVVSDILKEYLIRLTWNPLEGILVLTGFFLVLSVVLSILVRISSLFVRAKITMLHAYTLTVWASVPFVFLSPLGMSLFKVMQAPFYVVPSFVVLFLFLFWVIVRGLKGISVIYDMSSVKAYIGGGLAAAALIVLFVVYYDSEFSLTAYLEFLYNVTRSS